MKTRLILGIFACASLSTLAASAQAPASSASSQAARTDGRWTPYLGCWRLLAENVRNRSVEELIRSAAQSAVVPAVTVCVQPSPTSSGVTLTTFTDGKRVLDQVIVADGAGHPVLESGCEGTQTSDWSGDGFRLFTRVELACHDRPRQTVSGLTLFAQGPAWVDIQAMESGGDQQVRIRRYVRTFDQPQGLDALPAPVIGQAVVDAQNASARTLSQDAVTEASAKVSSQAVEAAIVETASRFNLDSRGLLKLSKAGVSPNVIDLMVAQSFPSHFSVERPTTVAPRPVAAAPPTYGVPGPQYPTPYPVYPYGTYDPYYYYSYYYSPFAYPYYWGNNYFNGSAYYLGNGTIGTPGGGTGVGGGSSQGTSGERGQVVNGRGYTRVHSGSDSGAPAADPGEQHPAAVTPRTVRPATTTATAPADSSSASGSGSSSSGSTASGSAGSAGGATASPGGYSSGGSGDTGRTARPK
jgi:hypothetical protein